MSAPSDPAVVHDTDPTSQASADAHPRASGGSRFRPAVRRTQCARIAVAGLPGSGRTLTALRIARALGDRIALLDTERGRAARYADEYPFDHRTLTDFDPEERLLPALLDATQQRYPVLIVDCYSQFWTGPGGMLDRVDRAADPRTGSTSAGWRANRGVDRRAQAALYAYPGHLIVTLRSKTEYAIAQDGDGQPHAHRLPMAPEQRAGIESDFDLVLTLGEHHRAHIDKSCIDGLPAWTFLDQPWADVGKAIRRWAETGLPAPDGFALLDLVERADVTIDELRQAWTAATEGQLMDMVAAALPVETTAIGEPPRTEIKNFRELLDHQGRRLQKQPPQPPASPQQPVAPAARLSAPAVPPTAPESEAAAAPKRRANAAKSTAAPSASANADVKPSPTTRDQDLAELHIRALNHWDDLPQIRAVLEEASAKDLLDEPVHDLQAEEHPFGALLTDRLADLTTPTPTG